MCLGLARDVIINVPITARAYSRRRFFGCRQGNDSGVRPSNVTMSPGVLQNCSRSGPLWCGTDPAEYGKGPRLE